MDTQSNSTIAPEVSIGEAAAAVVENASTMMAARRLAQTKISAADLAKLSMRELRNLYDALRLAENVVGGIINQPRFEVSKTNAFNGAGEVIDGLQNYLLNSIRILVEVASSSEPATADEAEDRAWLLIKDEALCGEGLADFVAFAAKQNAAADRIAYLTRSGRA